MDGQLLLALAILFAVFVGALAWGWVAWNRQYAGTLTGDRSCRWSLGDVMAVFTIGGGAAVVLLVPEFVLMKLQSSDTVSPAAIGRMLVVQNVCLVVSVYLWLKVRRQVNLSELGLVDSKWKGHLLAGLKCGLCLWVLGEIVQKLSYPTIHWLIGQKAFEALSRMESSATMLAKAVSSISWGGGIMLLLLVGIIAPFVEELMFRGFAYPPMKHSWGVRWGLVASGAYFAALHFSPLDFPTLWLIGIILGWLYEETGSLAAPFAAHAVNNIITVGLLLTFPRSGL